MKPVVSTEQMQQLDAMMIEKHGVSGKELMYRAGIGCTNEIIRMAEQRHADRNKKRSLSSSNLPCLFVVLCGHGNNGGDGFVIARELYQRGNQVVVLMVGKESRLSEEALLYYLQCREVQVPMYISDWGELEACLSVIQDLIQTNDDAFFIDALVGIGQNCGLRAEQRMICEQIFRCGTFYRVAIDTPSGLDSDRGDCEGAYIPRADMTLTIAAPKLGMIYSEHCGQVVTIDIGITEDDMYQYTSAVQIYEDDILPMVTITRPIKSSKFDYGKVGIIAGSKKYRGAGALCANSAIKSGVGLVHLFTSNIHPQLLPEVIIHEEPTWQDSPAVIDEWKHMLSRMDAIVIGPGLGSELGTIARCTELIRYLNEHTNIPIILDADALRAVALLHKEGIRLRANILLTPHHGEYAHLLGVSLEDFQKHVDQGIKHLIALQKEYSVSLGCHVLLKHIPNIVVGRRHAEDDVRAYLIRTGNPGMATAGSGDVLSGLLGGMMAQFSSLQRKAVLQEDKDFFVRCVALAVITHAKAGDLYAHQHEQLTLTASSLIEMLSSVFKEWFERRDNNNKLRVSEYIKK